MGSPPLTRELLEANQGNQKFHRITPAHAGTTAFLEFYETVARDHPRSRGNYLKVKFLDSLKLGSPPLTRELQRFTLGRI